MRICNAATRTITTTSPVGRVTTVTRDEMGRPQQVQAGTQEPVSYAYDDRGRISQLTVGDRSVRYEYNSDGRVAATIDPLDQRVAYSPL